MHNHLCEKKFIIQLAIPVTGGQKMIACISMISLNLYNSLARLGTVYAHFQDEGAEVQNVQSLSLSPS